MDAVPAVGLANTGGICWLAVVLQALASCPSVRAIAAGAAPADLTAVGSALARALAPPALAVDAADQVARALRASATMEDTANQCAHEGLGLLLAAAWRGAAPNPFLGAFVGRVRAGVYAADRRLLRPPVEQDETVFDLSDTDAATPAEFAGLLRRRLSPVDGPLAADGAAWRLYQLVRAPRVLVVLFDCFGRARATPPRARPFPVAFALDALRFRLVAQIEYAGSGRSGHYWGRFVRRSDSRSATERAAELAVCRIDDAAVAPVPGFAPTIHTFLLVYHWIE